MANTKQRNAPSGGQNRSVAAQRSVQRQVETDDKRRADTRSGKNRKQPVQAGARKQPQNPLPDQPEELSPAYVFLASPVCSSYISGTVLPVMGGPHG
jgi:NAD(P)-dependent dehydrogenase (short-subunit alcohol dehydrogenase family)